MIRRLEARVRAHLDFRLLFVRLYVLLTGLTLCCGGVVLAGGETRFSGPAYDTPRALAKAFLPDFMPPYQWWGVLFLLLGAALALSTGHMIAVHVLRFGIVVNWFLALGLAGSAWHNATVGLLGMMMFVGAGGLYLIMADHLYTRRWDGA